MDATWIITAFVLIDTLMERVDHQSDVRAQVPDSEVILIAVLSAKYFPEPSRTGRVHPARKSAICRAGLMSRASIAGCTSLPTGWSSSPRTLGRDWCDGRGLCDR